MPGILREENQLPRVTTKTGNYTAGTNIKSRSAQGSVPVGPSTVDFSSTPGLQKLIEPAPPSTGRYTQSNVQAQRGQQGAPPLPSQAVLPGVSVIPAAEAKSATTRAAAPPTRPTTPGFAARHFSANQPGGAPAKDGLPAETQNVYSLPGINRYTDASGVPTFTNKGRAGYDELQAQGGATGIPQISQKSLDRTLATSPVFTSMVRSAGGGRIDATSAGLAQQGFAEDQAAAKAAEDQQTAERGILKRLPGLPAAYVPGALASLGARDTARRGKPVTLDQIKAASAQQLLASGSEPTAFQNTLFGSKTPPAPQRRIVSQPTGEVDANGFPTGAKQFFSVDPATGESVPVALPGATGQGQGGGGRPADYPDAYQGRTPDGKQGWFVKREGKTYLVSE